MPIFFKNYLRQVALCVVAALALAGCAGNGGDLSPAGSTATTVTIVSHYGRGIGIPEAYLDGGYVGSVGGWGQGGGNCCVSLRSTGNQPMMVTVKWKTYRSNVDEERWHEETVPVHFAENKVGSLAVHFLPGHKVEVWSSAKYYPSSTVYPGPKYPYKPAPEYAPLADEKPNPTKVK
ncbi:DUF3304 domain-containing protein [Collimonas silvisoli]|uniref:DUF3304 domain-containing protein n=1 Tax=Collimonas silvisoli TaxID=2825884 RepID=UPI001B8AC25B|nr:DUF3304 domain-containing protein [Collimonas silvisoli]